MKHALIWIIDTFYANHVDEIWDNPLLWDEILNRHFSAYLKSPEFKETIRER